MTRLQNLLYTCVLLLTSSVVMAADHQISVDFSQSENYIGAQEPFTRMKPDIYSLAYGVTFDRAVSLNISYWAGEDEATYPDNDYVLEQESSGGSLSASWYLDAWSLNAVASRSKTENTLTSPSRPAQADQVQKFRELYFFADYTWQLRHWDLRPELGMGFQKSESDTRLNIKTANLKQLDTESQEDKGKYVQLGLSLAVWLEQGADWLWQPGVRIIWIDPVSGDGSISQQRSVRMGRFNRKASNASEEDNESDASGYTELSLSLYVDQFSITGYYSHTIDAPPNTETIGLSAGVSF